MKSTVVGPYPRIGSETGARLRKEVNEFYRLAAEQAPDIPAVTTSEGYLRVKVELLKKFLMIEYLKRDLTREVVQEMALKGIQLPNTGLIDVHDELTWPAEALNGVRFAGMKKIFHTNTHYRPIVVNGEVSRKAPIINALYDVAFEAHPQVKVELPGPYTMAQQSVLDKGSPYRDLVELARAYARVYRQELMDFKNIPFVQFNEPSAIAFGREHPNVAMLPELYGMMLEGLNVPVAVWTFYGKYSPETLDLLFSLPVDVIGLDFVWGEDVDMLLKKRTTDKGIGIGIVDSGDKGFIKPDSLDDLVARLRGLEGYINFNRVLVSSNATLEHLPREHASHKLSLINMVRRVSE